MADDDQHHAIVFGASGIIGWPVVDQLLSGYPNPGTFAKVTAVTNRPIELADSQWRTEGPNCPELQLVSGVDLTRGSPTELAEVLRAKVKDVDKISHIYYLVFTQVDDLIKEVATNLGMLKNVVGSLSSLTENLEFVLYPGGTRGYGVYIPGGTFTPPLTESMADNLPEDYAKTVAYPANRDFLSTACRGEGWTWCEVCPDAIIGFTPNGSQYSLALHWAQYLSLYAHNHGVGPPNNADKTSTVKVPFPGNEAGYNAQCSPVSATTLARFSIFASLRPETCGGGRLFNVADREEPSTFKEVWPAIAAWFGLVGVGPGDENHGVTPEEGDGSSMPGDYVERHQHIFADMGLPKAAGNGVGAGRRQLDGVGTWLSFDRQLSLEKLRGTGFDEERMPAAGWLESFEMFRKAGLIL